MNRSHAKVFTRVVPPFLYCYYAWGRGLLGCVASDTLCVWCLTFRYTVVLRNVSIRIRGENPAPPLRSAYLPHVHSRQPRLSVWYSVPKGQCLGQFRVGHSTGKKNRLIALSPANHNDYLRIDWKTRQNIHRLHYTQYFKLMSKS